MEEAKDHLEKLIAQKDKLEGEIEALLDYLMAPGNPGLSGGLIDADGFPIEDVEKIIAVRGARGKLAMKKNDHTALMAQIEEALFGLHAIYKAHSPDDDVPRTHEVPVVPKPSGFPKGFEEQFAFVASVKAASPAEKSGLKENDQIYGFGTINYQNNRNLQALPDVVHENVPVVVIVKRQDEIIHLNLTPQKWSGPGLLGAHLKPFKK